MAAAAMLPATPALAQAPHGRSERSYGSATVAVRIAISTRQDFVLGSVLLRSPALVSTLRVSPAEVRVVDNAVRPGGVANTEAQASFVVTGEADQLISIAMPETVDLTRVGGDQIMTIAMLTDLPHAADPQILQGADGAIGVLSFNVGGRAIVGSDVVPGLYRGIVTATAQYN